MSFLGNFGIDTHLLIAQVINFILLVWLLAYFVYKPTIKMIEKNEAEIGEGQRQKKALDEEVDAFAKQKKDLLEAIRTRNKRTVEEMKRVSDRAKSDSSLEAEKESFALINQTREALKLEKPAMLKEAQRDLKTSLGKNLKNSFDQVVAPEYQSEFQDVLFKIFIKKIDAALLPKLSPSEIKQIQKVSKGDKKKGAKMLREKTGRAFLEYAVAFPAKERKEVEAVVSEKIGMKVTIEAQQNKLLVNGFRLEIMGRIIESNLSKIVTNAQNS